MGRECVNCGVVSDNMTNTEEGFVCDECLDNHYSTCEECDCNIPREDMIGFNDILYCEDCFNKLIGYCEECGYNILRENLTDIGSNSYLWVCHDCMEENHICNECGDVVERLIDGMCEYCHENYRVDDDVDSVIENYNYKPNPIFFGEGNRFFGVELETEPWDEDGEDVDMVREIKEYVSEWAYLKHDGSLGKGGFELVTHPMTLEHHIEKFTPELFNTIRDSDYVSHTHGNCGLHIHISRTAFKSDLAIVKLLEFVYGNYENVVSKLGRRGNKTNYCLENEIPSCLMYIERIFRINNEDRYYAINTKNKDTIELRFFRGTLVRDTFVSALQFADVLVNLANNIEDMDKKIKWADVYLEVCRLGYEELLKEMGKRLDITALLEEEYEGYKLIEEEIKPIVKGYEEGGEISSSISGAPDEIEWTRRDRFYISPEVLDEFNRNYVNRYELDGQPADIPSGTMVQIMPLTMMEYMRRYGRHYPRDMNRFAGSIYKVINCGDFYRLEDFNCYSFDRSSFRVLSEQELINRGYL